MKDKDLPIDLLQAINIIESANDLWRQGCTEITPDIKSSLIKSKSVLESYLPSKNSNIDKLMQDCEYIINNASILHSYKFKDSDNIADSVLNQLV